MYNAVYSVVYNSSHIDVAISMSLICHSVPNTAVFLSVIVIQNRYVMLHHVIIPSASNTRQRLMTIWSILRVDKLLCLYDLLQL